jgi:hypothetical protein
MIRRTIAVAGSAAVALLISGCFGTNEDAKTRGEFIKGCLSTGTGMQKEDCSCAYDKLESTYGKERLSAFERHPENIPGEFVNVSLNAMLVCSGKPPLPGMEPKKSQAPAQPKETVPKPPVEVGGPIDGSRDYTEFGNGEVPLAPGATNPSSTAPEEAPSSI